MRAITFIRKNFWILVNILVLVGYLSVANFIRLKEPRPLIKDSEEYVILSHNLAFNGVFSYDGEMPTNFREPVSSFLNAINIRLFTNIKESIPLERLISQPDIVTQLTQINIFYLFLLYLSMWWLTFQIMNAHAWVVLSTFLTMSFFTIGTTYLQSLLSDLPSIILLIFTVSVLLSLYKKPKIWNSIALSFCLAALMLSKGVFFYLGPIYMLFIGALFCFQPKDLFRILRIKYLVLSLFGSILFLSPWMIRNQSHFDDFSLTQRGGTILMIRAEKDQMNHEEFKGAFYVYSPNVLKRLMFEWIGYKQSDYWDGGKLQRLNRDLKNDNAAIEAGDYERIHSFLRKTMYVTIPAVRSEALQKGIDPDKYLKEKAVELIMKNPAKHLKTSLAFAWRGLWFYQGNHLSYVLLIAISYFAFLYIFFKSVFSLDVMMLVFFAMPVLVFLFHSLLTHNISRYLLPMLPFVSISLVVLVSLCRNYFFNLNLIYK